MKKRNGMDERNKMEEGKRETGWKTWMGVKRERGKGRNKDWYEERWERKGTGYKRERERRVGRRKDTGFNSLLTKF